MLYKFFIILVYVFVHIGFFYFVFRRLKHLSVTHHERTGVNVFQKINKKTLTVIFILMLLNVIVSTIFILYM